MTSSYQEKWKSRIKFLETEPYPDDPSEITIHHIMAREFPDVKYEAMRDPDVHYMTHMKVKYHDPEEIKLAIENRIPAAFGVTVEEVKDLE